MSELIGKATEMINDFIVGKGISLSEAYSPDKKMWSLKRGSANIQIILLTVPVGENVFREFVQAASPIMLIPKGRETELYRKLLELNDVKLGIKFSIQKGTDQVWALAERDLIGMGYSELTTVLEDFGFWADELDDVLKKEFSS